MRRPQNVPPAAADQALAGLRSRMTSRPLTGRAISSTLNPFLSSCGHAAPSFGPVRTVSFAGNDERLMGMLSRAMENCPLSVTRDCPLLG
jgi:hypothetical protein